MKKFLTLIALMITMRPDLAHAQTDIPVVAKSDYFSTTPIYPLSLSVTTASILANDSRDNVPGTFVGPGGVTLVWLSAAPTGITLNANGTITVAPGTVAGAYVFDYRISTTTSPHIVSAAYAAIYVDEDSDGDGVANLSDQDDDNDGILDGSPVVYGEAQECAQDLFTAYSTYSNNVLVVTDPITEISNPNYFLRIRPSDFNFPGLPGIPRTPGHPNTINLNATHDYSGFFGLPAGSIMVDIENANVHPSYDEFYIQDALGASNRTRIKVYGTVGSYIGAEHGMQYFRNQERGITFLDGTTPSSGQFQVGMQTTDPGVWSSGINEQYCFVKREIATGTANAALHFANINPGMLKYVEFYTDNTESTEYSTFFFRLFPECDTDKDGIPNRLDLDSDNDGCLDALEGGAGLVFTDLVNAGGTLSAGAGSSAQNKNLCADVSCVNANGCPFITGSGQLYDHSYDASLMSAICMSVLPVKLTKFTVLKNNYSMFLNWTTSSEQNSKGFGIERCGDDRNWTTIAFVKSLTEHGNSNTKLDYRYIDQAPLKGVNYYRLRQTDLNGTYEYSTVQAASFDARSGSIMVFPNPTFDNIAISGLRGNETILIHDTMGRKIKQIKTAGASITIDLSDVNTGVYNIQVVSNNGTTVSHKVVKVR